MQILASNKETSRQNGLVLKNLKGKVGISSYQLKTQLRQQVLS